MFTENSLYFFVMHVIQIFITISNIKHKQAVTIILTSVTIKLADKKHNYPDI